MEWIHGRLLWRDNNNNNNNNNNNDDKCERHLGAAHTCSCFLSSCDLRFNLEQTAGDQVRINKTIF